MVDAYASLQSANAVPRGLTLSAQELYFSGTPVGVSSPIQSITLANAGTSIINISHFPLSPGSDFGGIHYCPTALSTGQTCYLELQMSPTSTGERDGYVQVVSDAPGSPHVIRLQGLDHRRPFKVFFGCTSGPWAYNYIMGIYNAGITTGCSQNPLMYCPDNSVTREQMAVFIIRSLNQVPTDGYCGGISPFTDIGIDRWSCKYIKRLAELGVTTGYGDGRFGPEDSITREQMAVFLTKALASVPPDGYCGATSPFTDVTYDRWSCKYIKKFAELGITSGYGDGRYGPSDYVNRAQMAVFLARAFLGM